MKSNSSNTCTLTEILEYNYENIKNITDKSLFLQTCMENYYGAVQEFLEIDPEIILIRINNIYPLEFVCLRNNKLMAKILCEHLKRNKYIFDFNLCLQICKFKKFICLFEIILFYINYSNFHYIPKIMLSYRYNDFNFLLNHTRIMFFTHYNGLSLAHWAVITGSLQWIRTVLISSHQLKIKTRVHGLTILHLAIILQKLKPIRLLLKFGASVTDVTRKGYNILHLTVVGRNLALFKYFLFHYPQLSQNPDNNGYLPIHFALFLNERTMFMKLLEHFNHSSDYYANSVRNISMFHYCCYFLHTDSEMGYLLFRQYVENPTITNLGHTPLHVLAAVPRPNFLNIFFDKLIYQCKSQKTINSPLHVAIINRNEIFIRMAIRFIHVDIRDYYGNTPLHIACKVGDLRSVKILIKFRCDIAARNYEMYTSVMLSVLHNNINIVSYLLSLHADIYCLNVYNQTAIKIAYNYGFNDIYRLLKIHHKLFTSRKLK